MLPCARVVISLSKSRLDPYILKVEKIASFVLAYLKLEILEIILRLVAYLYTLAKVLDTFIRTIQKCYFIGSVFQQTPVEHGF